MTVEAGFPNQPRPLPDGAFDSNKLDQAETMTEYCTELRTQNATFYEDLRTCVEALRKGWSDKSTLTKTWDGFA
jgi:hypothetical protein